MATHSRSIKSKLVAAADLTIWHDRRPRAPATSKPNTRQLTLGNFRERNLHRSRNCMNGTDDRMRTIDEAKQLESWRFGQG
jgi:hypothetical protein